MKAELDPPPAAVAPGRYGLRPMTLDDIPTVQAIERDSFPSAQELVDWAKFLEISCGACSTPS